jgi:hypothetical protein
MLHPFRRLLGFAAILHACVSWADVGITFLPPPHEGTISLGIYNKSGALIRTLFKEASDKDFTVGLNGFITQWDGKDDAGQLAPPGKYFARGLSVGEIEVEGIAFHLNDWIADDNTIRIREISELHLSPEGDLVLRAKLAQDKIVFLRRPKEGGLQPVQETVAISSSKGSVRAREPWTHENSGFREPEGQPLPALPSLEKPVAAWHGKEGSFWVIAATDDGSELRQYSAESQLLRSVKIPASEPQPVQLVVSLEGSTVFLLERSKTLHRVRGLEFSGKPNPDAPENPAVVFSRSIEPSETFSAVAARLGNGKPLVAESKFKVRLLANPLFKEALQEISVKLGFDREGTVLMDSTGLILCGLTATPNLKWASMVPDGSKALRIFQSDGLVVEEFRARKLANMMAFEAGEYELAAPPKQK